MDSLQQYKEMMVEKQLTADQKKRTKELREMTAEKKKRAAEEAVSGNEDKTARRKLRAMAADKGKLRRSAEELVSANDNI